MTLDTKSYIKIPTWILTVALPLLVAGFGSYIAVRLALTSHTEKIQNLEAKQIEYKEVLKTKANVETVTNLIEKVDEINAAVKDLNTNFNRYILKQSGINTTTR